MNPLKLNQFKNGLNYIPTLLFFNHSFWKARLSSYACGLKAYIVYSQRLAKFTKIFWLPDSQRAVNREKLTLRHFNTSPPDTSNINKSVQMDRRVIDHLLFLNLKIQVF